ncbi:hypothetical protein LPJ56_003950 [Coemansia sp. RSA 2599]|nr:hypothetical protein LPJ56_003950 [Coemansia sp. RSA 2599]
MGADSKHLTWLLQRVGREARARIALRRSAQHVLSSGSLNGAPKPHALPPESEHEPAANEGRSLLKPLQKWHAKRGRNASSVAESRAKGASQLSPPKQLQRSSALQSRHPLVNCERQADVDYSSSSSSSSARGDTAASARRRRWVTWSTVSGWDFPTLNSSFPFTIPSIPAGIFLFAQQTGHSSMPSGVMMPPGLGTSARKFHSVSLNRQPGVPIDGDEDGGSSSAFADAAPLSAQALHAEIAAKLKTSQNTKSLQSGSSRRAENAPSSARLKSPKNYMFAHAATGIPKFENRVPLPKKTVPPAISASSGNIKTFGLDGTEEEMATSAGEDAFFHRSDALGIADGVGGWAGVKDADPSLFARRLMHHVCLEVQRYEDIDDEMFSHYYEAAPVDILRRAYDITLDEMEAMAMRGSSTACVVVLRGDELRVANLGDCGLTVVRQGDMVYRTEEQQHSFNFPYQLSTETHSDRPSDAQVFRLKIQKGDVIIVGSDGVFDNLFDEDILEEVNQHLPPIMRAEGEPELKYANDSLWYESQQSSDRLEALCENAAPENVVATGLSSSKVVSAPPKFSLPQFHVDPSAISLAIARRAKLVSEDTRYAESPFQMRAMQEGLYYQGGKRDDITVVVAVVTDLEDTPDRR